MAERAEPTLYNRREVDPRQAQVQAQRAGGPANLADILERVLDKGIVIAGDIQINLLDIELLTIKLRLLVASVERAQEMGINWWESDPTLSGDAKQLEKENQDLRARLERIEKTAGAPAPPAGAGGGGEAARSRRGRRGRVRGQARGSDRARARGLDHQAQADHQEEGLVGGRPAQGDRRRRGGARARADRGRARGGRGPRARRSRGRVHGVAARTG